MISKSALALRNSTVSARILLANTHALRRFSSATAAGGQQYESFDDNIFYTPVRKLTFNNGVSTIFNQPADNPNQLKYVPWEIKEATVKNFLGVIGFAILDYLFHPGALVYSIGAFSFGINWMHKVYHYLGHAITKIDLHEDGKTVTVQFKTGGTATLKIKDIMKKSNEKELVQTFEEGFMFPIEVANTQKYYIYGRSHEAIKNGEIFRAIINGQAIKL
jgi:hypothetical protein